MSRKNELLDALRGDDEVIGVNRRELKEALSELSTSGRRTQVSNSIDKRISSQIFKILFGLILLGAILSFIFIYGFRYLLGENPQFSDLSSNLPSGEISKKINWNENKIFSFFSKKPTQGKILDYVLPKGENYYIQVALCKYKKCSQKFSANLEKLGYEPQVFQTQVLLGSGYNEIVSRQSFSLQKAQDLTSFINAINDRSGYASVVPTEKGKFRISLGTFPNRDIAEDLRRYYESITVADQVRFVFSKTTSISGNGLSQIVAGPFSTKKRLLDALTRIKKEKIFSDAFITNK